MKHDDIGFLIKQISDRMKAHADADMKSSDLTLSQFYVLGYLARHDKEASQKEIEEFLGVSHPTVVGLIGRLDRKGFVESYVDSKDRRVKRIRMTQKAIELGEHMRRERVRSEQRIRAKMTEAEARELVRLLRIVLDNVNEQN